MVFSKNRKWLHWVFISNRVWNFLVSLLFSTNVQTLGLLHLMRFIYIYIYITILPTVLVKLIGLLPSSNKIVSCTYWHVQSISVCKIMLVNEVEQNIMMLENVLWTPSRLTTIYIYLLIAIFATPTSRASKCIRM